MLSSKIVTVTATGFTPADVSLKKGDYVRWQWEAGSRTIVVSENPAGSEEPNVLVTFGINEVDKTQQLQFNETSTYYYYDPQDQRFTGTITVLEATPVSRTTWGFIKSVFENP
jgi:plastocyanin